MVLLFIATARSVKHRREQKEWNGWGDKPSSSKRNTGIRSFSSLFKTAIMMKWEGVVIIKYPLLAGDRVNTVTAVDARCADVEQRQLACYNFHRLTGLCKARVKTLISYAGEQMKPIQRQRPTLQIPPTPLYPDSFTIPAPGKRSGFSVK